MYYFVLHLESRAGLSKHKHLTPSPMFGFLDATSTTRSPEISNDIKREGACRRLFVVFYADTESACLTYIIIIL